MALHEVQLKGYSVRPGNLSLGTFDSYGIEQLHVTLDDTWSGLAVTATFNPPEGEPVEIRVPENGLIDVPAEATANEGTGTIVYCGVANGAQRISKTQGYSVITHGNVGTTVPFNPSESLATQVLQAALSAEKNSAEANTAAQSAQTAAENAAVAAQASAESASKAAEEAAAAKPYAESAKASAEAARNSENQAQQSSAEATDAKNAAQNAQAGAESSATAAAKSAKEAAASAVNLDSAANTATQKAAAASASAAAAKTSESAAASSEAATRKHANSAESAAKTAGEAATAAAKAKTAAESAQADAAASKTDAANSAIAAKTSEDAAANSAADADRTANSINDSMTQIAANKEAVSQLKEDKVNKNGEAEITIENLDFVTVEQGKNKLDLAKATYGKCFNNEGVLVETSTGMTTDFINYENGKNLLLSRRNPDNGNQSLLSFNAYVLYDSAKNPISHGYSSSGFTNPFLLDNEVAKYIRVSLLSYSANRQYQIEISTASTFSHFEEYFKKIHIPSRYLETDNDTVYNLISKYKPYTGKKITVIGDSLTDMSNGYVTKNWLGLVEDNLGFEAVNLAKSGTGYINGVNESKSFWDRTKTSGYIPSDSNIVIIFGSFNDASAIGAMSLPYGEITDGIFDRGNSTNESTDEENIQNNVNFTPSTVYGYINATINNIYAQVPNVVLGIIAPNPWFSPNPMSKDTQTNVGRDYVNILKNICEYRGVPFLDLFHCSGIRPWTYSAKRDLYYSKDGVHPNEQGHEMFLYPHIREFIKTLI